MSSIAENSGKTSSNLEGPPVVSKKLPEDLTDIGEEGVQRSLNNGDPNKWKWSDADKGRWHLAPKKWQDFNEHWRTTPESVNRTLPLTPIDNENIVQEIYIRRCYLEAFTRIWIHAFSRWNKKGVLLTGQPGTGKTLFLYYLLTRLLQKKQVVLFSPDGIDIFLFYHDKVYQSSSSVRRELPRGVIPKLIIWSLFDMRKAEEPNRIFTEGICFPVQSAFPDPKQYKVWRKEHAPLIFGLPLWDRQELYDGLECQLEYPKLLEVLEEVFPGDRASWDPMSPQKLSGFSGADVVLQDYYPEDKKNPTSPTPTEALSTLIDAAIHRFGYAARDVFTAVFGFDLVIQSHRNATYQHLRDVLSTFYRGIDSIPGVAASHWILTARPIYGGHPLKGDSWALEFKSLWLRRSLMARLLADRSIDIRQDMHHFRRNQETAPLVVWLLEAVGHRKLIEPGTSPNDCSWPLFKMTCNNLSAGHPKYTLGSSAPASRNAQLAKTKRTVLELQSARDLPTSFQQNAYYIPTASIFPPFDAFTVEFDLRVNIANLWFLQMTTSPTHQGSASGCQIIDKLARVAREQLRQEAGLQTSPNKARQTDSKTSASLAEVVIHYVLVTPDKRGDHEYFEWEFPEGWKTTSGNVYWLDLSEESCDTTASTST